MLNIQGLTKQKWEDLKMLDGGDAGSAVFMITETQHKFESSLGGKL